MVEHKPEAGQVFIPLQFAPRDAYQFDWSHKQVILGDKAQTVKVAHIRLYHSRKFRVVAYLRESMERIFDAHARAFEFFGGTCRHGIYDNISTAVDRVLQGKARRVQQAVHANVQSLSDRTGSLRASFGLGERSDRKASSRCSQLAVCAQATIC